MQSKNNINYRFGNTVQNKITLQEEIIDTPLPNNFITINNYFVGKINGEWCAYDNICDHNGGILKLDATGKTATCPIHKWTLNLNKAQYENGCRKKKLDIKVINEKLLISKNIESFSQVDSSKLVDAKMHFNFNAHASISIEIDNLNFISDPWFIGPCFTTGWWHKYPPSEEALSRLLNSQLIYISHNHPDHLHIPTLQKYVSKDKPFLIPNFTSKSVEKILRSNGFNNLIVANFLEEILIRSKNGEILFILVKSGDDRDDSSLLISTKKNKVFLGVDTNMPNDWILPEVDMLFTSFAGGASGFPSRIENFTAEKINEIALRNKKSTLNNYVAKLIKATKPKYVIPYAGYFAESHMDADVKELNKKNSENELLDFVEERFKDIKAINPIKKSNFDLYEASLTVNAASETPLYFIDEEYIDSEIQSFKSYASKKEKNEMLKEIGEIFINSLFTEELTIIIIPSDNNFKSANTSSLLINFSEKSRYFQLIDLNGFTNEYIIDQELKKSKNKIEILRIRSDIFFSAVTKGLPLEELSIGFQIKMYREPNIYNFNFWNHFTNQEIVKLSTQFG